MSGGNGFQAVADAAQCGDLHIGILKFFSQPVNDHFNGFQIHFLGICGTAMGAVAAAMHERGFVVTGSDDSVYPPMSTFLESRGIRIHNGYKPGNIPGDTQLVVIGNAISRGNEEAEAVLDDSLSGELLTLLIDLRKEAKAAKQWAQADMIRDRLKALGIGLVDQKDGTTTWERLEKATV